MSVVITDIITGGLRETAAGPEHSRWFYLQVDPGGAPTRFRVGLRDAQIPDIGDPSDDGVLAGEGVVCVSKEITPNDGLNCVVECRYALPTIEEIPESFPNGIQTVTTTFATENVTADVNGVGLGVQYQGNDNQFQQGTRFVTAQQQVPMVNVQQVLVVPKADNDAVFRLAITHVGGVNDAVWSTDYPAKSWRFNALQIAPTLRNEYIRTTYSITYRPDVGLRRGWEFLGSWHDNGRIPFDAQDQAVALPPGGYGYFDLMKLVDFNDLPFTVPSIAP